DEPVSATPEPTAEPTPVSTPTPSQEIIVAQESSRGDAVTQIQTWLIALGYLNDVADGIYGSNTAEAVKTFQSDNGIDITGSVSEALFATLREMAEQNDESDDQTDEPAPTPTPSVNDNVVIAQTSSRGDIVTDIQTRLIRLGYLEGVADGIYGQQTSQAVSRFQRALGLNETGRVTQGLYNQMLSLTRRGSIVGFDSFLAVFNEAQKNVGVNMQLQSPEIPAAGGTVTYRLDQYTTLIIVVDGSRAVKTVTINGTPDGFAEGDLSILNACQSALVSTGAVAQPIEGRRFLEQIGAYDDALKEQGEGSSIIDDIEYSWSAGEGQISLRMTVEI
ncbi:MAG: peptidoglycan-binding protein, partial [Clostridia bacterium]|nr:peptidoglycan-binding protein [Clostridia bacterium]